MRRALGRKFLTIVAFSSIIVQSLSPFLVILPQAYAQEATPTPTATPADTVSPTPTPTVSPTPAPTDIASPTPTDTPIPTDTASPTPTPVPTDTVTPTPAPVDNLSPPSDTTSTPSDSPSPSAEVQADSASPLPSVTPSPSSEPTPIESGQATGNEQLSLIILDNVSAPSIDLEAVESKGSATLTTDKPDYAPTDTALITGSNLLPNTTYTLRVWSDDEPPTSTTVEVTSDENGVFAYAYQLDGIYRPNYKAELRTMSGDLVATVTFTDAIDADLDQYGNDAPAGWQNGNLNASQATYFEGDSVPYRIKFNNLTIASHNVVIEWDTTKSGKHALDYITTFDRTVASADPCIGVSSCGAPTTFAIPADPQVTGAGVTPVAGNFTFYGGTITSVSAYSYPTGSGFSGDKSARITITFTASQDNPVLAWGGHIAHRSNWGQDNSAIAIPGSPYHTRLIDLDGKGGNQDRSLSADAVIFPASITIIKDATPNGSTSFPFTASPSPLSNFSLVDDGTSANTQVFSNITNFQTYTVSETVPGGWTLNSIVCGVTSPNGGSQTVSNPSVSIDLEEGENVTCTYNNEQQAAHLIVIKHVINDNGGTATASAFTMTINGVTATGGNSFPGQESPGTDKVVSFGSYNVTESGPSGYSASYSTDCTGTIAAGQTKTCTVTNNDIQPKLTVTKVVVNDNGGTKVVSDFPLFVGATQVTSGVQNGFNAGSYVVSETQQTGYTQTSITGDCDANGNVTLAAGDVKACTITNNDNAPALHLRKTVTNDNGGSALVTDWTLTATGTGGSPTNLSGTTPVDSGSSFKADTYALAETGGPSGYTAGAWNCGNATMPDTTHVTVPLGGNVTCTINNNDDAAHLIVIKHVVTDNGGTAVASDFTMTINGVTATGGNSFAGVESPGTNKTLTTVGAYNVTESGPLEYSASYSTDCTGTIALGETKTCTVTNNDNAPQLHLRKTVTKDNGGNASATDWTLTATGTGQSPTNLSGTTPVDSGATFKADTYALGESGPSGYTAGAWNCGGATMPDPTHVTVPLGGSATCTITNDDNAPSLTLVKVVDNNDGGTAVPADWTLTAAGPTGFSGPGPSVSNGTSFDAGTYTLSESSAPSGYTNGTTWGCVGGTQGDATHITVGLGESATCTIHNSDNTPQLKLVKVVDNNDGGTATAHDYTLSATATGNPLGRNFSGLGDSNTFHDVSAGSSYELAENPNPGAGYTAGSWSCSGTGSNMPDATHVTVALGGSVTCTIHNDDIAPTLKLVKNVTKDNGGTATPANWDLSATGSSNSFTDAGNSTTFHTVKAGVTYTLSESGPSGYTAGAWSCDGGSLQGNQLTLGLNQNVTCTITNNDNAPSLTLVKVVSNTHGGNAVATDWVLTAAGPTTISGAGGATSDSTFSAGAYTLSESAGPSGYDAGDWSCVKNNNAPVIGSSITLVNGDNATCTITNYDKTAQITLIKNVINDNGGTAGPDNFGISIHGFNVLSGATHNVDSNTAHAINETGLSGYSFVSITGNAKCPSVLGGSVTLDEGESIICTITNDDDAPSLTLDKIVVNNNAGNASEDDWTLTADGPTPISGPGSPGSSDVVSGADFEAGTYTLSESTGPSGYNASSWSCTGDVSNNANQITLGLGQSATCTITNDDVESPILTISKENNTGGADKAPNDTVGYTITLNISEEGGPATNVQVTDLLPEGFVYVAGSWGASSAGLGDLFIPEPTYASPGVWNLVDTTNSNTPYVFNPGDTIVLTYSAKIDGSQAGGTYYDNAWGQATPVGSSSIIFANADIGDLDPGTDPSEFVGTQVTVVNGGQPGVNFNVTSTQEVLGASTFLPATGEPTLWVIIATLLSILGLGSLILGIRLRRRYVE